MTVHRLKCTVLAVVASVFGAAFGDIVSPARLGAFRSKVSITVAKTVADTAAGVPVPVRLAENNPVGFSYADCDPTQMRFGDKNYAPIPFEVDTWNPQGESLVWVKVPLVEGTKINLAYNGTATVANDPSAVWGDYTGVWHFETLDESVKVTNAQGTYPNSTAAEGIDGNVSTYSVPGEPGRFGNCFRVNDSTGYKVGNYNKGGVWVNDAGTASPVDGGENFTISGWFKHGNFQYFWDHFFYKRAASNNGGTPNNAFAIEINSSSGNTANPYPRGSSGTGRAVTLSNNLLDTWGYITFAYDGTTCHVYENGVLRGDVTITKCIDNDSPLVFGDNSTVTAGNGDAAWNGWIDEVRFAKGTKSAAFIAAEYAAMTTDGLLYYGAVETADPSAIVVSSNIGPCGTVSPDYGAIEGPVAGQEYVFACTDKIGVLVEDAKRGVCTGWKLVDTWSGELLRSSLDEGEEPFVCHHVYQAGKGVSLEWQWRVEYRVAATVAPSQGRVELSGEWFATGEKVTAKATAESGSAFLYWTGDGVTDDNKNDNPLTLTVGTAAIGLTPVFSSSIFVSPNGSDENSGKSWDEALATIHAALAKGPILTVFLAEGLYDVQAAAQVENQVKIVGSGERASVVRLAAEPADTSDRDKEQAVFYLNNANARLENLAITTGGKTYGRGVYVANGRVENCSITNCVTNNGRFNGAGIYMKSGSVCNCFINDNMASSSGGNNKEGGGIYMEGGLVENCTISSNYACYARGGSGSGHGGGVRIKGGTLRSSLVVGNLAHGKGSGVNASGDTSVVENCTVVKNDNLSSTFTSGLYASGKTVVRNTIVRYNRNTAGEANVYRDSTATFDRVCTTDEAGETGVIAEAPVFADAEGGDWRLTYCSCVDAGADMPWMAGATDLDGTPRIAGEHVDIGCYEFVATGLACSFNVTTDGVLDEVQATFAGAVIGAAPEAVTFSWTIVDSAGNKTERSGLGLKDVTLPLTTGAYTVTLAVTDGVNSDSVTRTDAVRVFATNLYVSPTGANTLPYGDFATAATNLLDALAFAADGSTVHLSDGIHRVSDKIVLTKAITLTHEGDREACIVTGNTGGSLVVLDNAEAHLEGLDLCGQYPRLVFNATLDPRPKSAYDTTHGVQIVSGGSVSNCVVESCRATGNGAGVYMSAGTVVDTVIRGNYAYSSGGGGASGAGIFMDGGLVDRCIITNNLASFGSGAHGGGAYVKGGGTLRNTLVAYNYGSNAGGVKCDGGTVRNCTIVRNVARTANGGIGGTVTDCLVYGNMANGVDVDTDDPGFVNAAAGDFHLNMASTAIDGSVKEGIGECDLDRNERYSGGVADKGCFEYDQSRFSVGIRYERLAAFAPCDVVFTASAGFKPLDTAKSWWTFDGREPTEEDHDLSGVVVTKAIGPGMCSVRFKTVLEGETYEVSKEDWFMLTGENVYVNPQNATPQEPFASWETAAVDINEGLRYLVTGATLVVSDGTYRVTAEHLLDRKATVRSLNGPSKTVLTRSRPFVLKNAEAMLSGFTISDVYTFSQGGALQMSAGTVTNCVFANCSVGNNGGGAVYMSGGTVVDCVVSNCSAKYYANDNNGSGIRAHGASALVDRCVVRDCWYESDHYARGAVALSGGATLRNSIVMNNRSYEGGGVRVSDASKLENCTVFGNSSDKAGAAGGVEMADANGLAVNTIVWQNTNTADGVIRETAGSDAQFDTCWLQDPLFLPHGKPCRLRTASPCRDAAKTLGWMGESVDVYGNPRIRCQKPDIGAAEGAFGFILNVK